MEYFGNHFYWKASSGHLSVEEFIPVGHENYLAGRDGKRRRGKISRLKSIRDAWMQYPLQAAGVAEMINRIAFGIEQIDRRVGSLCQAHEHKLRL